MRLFTLTLLALLAAIGGCTLPRPIDSSAYSANCELKERPPANSLLFVTLRLPDCRDPSLLKMTWHRGERMMYGAVQGDVVRFYDPSEWWNAALERLDAPKPPLLYIHGYNNDNAVALARAAAIRTAVHGNREVIALTWPSYNRTTKYFWDEANAEWTMAQTRDLVRRLADKHPQLIIVAHSMGNRVALDVLADLRSIYGVPPVERLIMASPDVDRASLVRNLRNGIGTKVTLYGSTRDQPLSASWRSHGYARGGDLSHWVTGHVNVYPYDGISGLDVIDTSKVSRSVLRHSDFIETKEGAADLCRVIIKEDTKLGRNEVPGHPGTFELLKDPTTQGDCASWGEEAARSLR